ncbi:MAG: hypothetical protein V4478_00395 [Patescibacteria group bacterium]
MKKYLIAVIALFAVIAGMLLLANRPQKTMTPLVIPPAAETPAPIVLQKDGLSVAKFGDSPETVIAAITKTLGAPTKDTGMTSSFSAYGTCPGNELRGVEWKNFYVLFGDTVFGTYKFFQYGYSSSDAKGLLASTLKTDKGVTVGMSLADAKKAYPNARVGVWLPGQDSITFEERSANKREYLGGTIVDGKLYWLGGGVLCGE